MTDNSYKWGMCIFSCMGLSCFTISLVCLLFYIVYAGNKSYEFLGEVAVYTVLLSFLFFVIRANIRDENKGKSTKVTPVV